MRCCPSASVYELTFCAYRAGFDAPEPKFCGVVPFGQIDFTTAAIGVGAAFGSVSVLTTLLNRMLLGSLLMNVEATFKELIAQGVICEVLAVVTIVFVGVGVGDGVTVGLA